MRREALCFQENLLICLKDEDALDKKPVGAYLISIEKIGHQGLNFLIHIVSTMKIDGILGGTKIIGSVTEKLQGLEEKRNELGQLVYKFFKLKSNFLIYFLIYIIKFKLN